MQKLLLYIDPAYILPAILWDDGRYVCYGEDNGNRLLWLYFHSDEQSQKVDFGEQYGYYHSLNKPGYYGDFFSKCVQEDSKSDIGSYKFPYRELLEFSGIVGELREFCTRNNTEVSNTSTVVLFAECISKEAREVFLKYLQGKGFPIVSYSKQLTDIISDSIVSNGHTPAFGEKILFLQSSGQDLYMSVSVYDGTRFTYAGVSESVQNTGDSLLKKELVTHVVEQADSISKFLNQEERKDEIAYQMQFADQWLKKYAEETSDTVHISFKFSSAVDVDTIYINIKKVFIENLQKKAAKDLLQKIRLFYNKRIKDDIYRVVLYGSLFKDDILREQMQNEVVKKDNKIEFLNESKLQQTLAEYNKYDVETPEKIEDLSRIYDENKQKSDKVAIWVKNSEEIRSYERKMHEIADKYKSINSQYISEYEKRKEKWLAYMKKSNFTSAEVEITAKLPSNDDVKKVREEYAKLLDEGQKLQDVIKDLSQFEAAKEIIKKVESDKEEIKKLDTDFENKEKEQKENRECIDGYKNLLEEFNSTTIRSKKQKIIAEIQKITSEKELLPMIDVPEVTITITVKVETRKDGFFKKKKFAMISWTSDTPLPCDSVLVITTEQAIDFEKNQTVYNIEKGKVSGEPIEFEIVDKNLSSIFVYVWAIKDGNVRPNSYQQNNSEFKLTK